MNFFGLSRDFFRSNFKNLQLHYLQKELTKLNFAIFIEKTGGNMRVSNLRKEIKEVDGFIVTNLPNIYYLVGFTGSSGVLVITQKEAVFFTDFRYKEQCAREIKDADVVIIKKSLIRDVLRHSVVKSLKKIGFEESIKYSSYSTLKKGLKGKKFLPLKNEVGKLRKIKEPGEIKTIKEAAKLSLSSFEDIKSLVKPGVREEDIAVELEYRMKKNGAQDTSFETIVASGPNAALPHARAGNRKLKDGDTVVLDFGVMFNHYASDTTRTIILGENPKANEIYKIAEEAQLAAIRKVKIGVPLKELDRIARDIISDAGYGEYFGHSLGHGVGLEVHEGPSVSGKSEDTVETGMVFTVEPGIYLPNSCGVRIEDMVVVKDKGIEIITKI